MENTDARKLEIAKKAVNNPFLTEDYKRQLQQMLPVVVETNIDELSEKVNQLSNVLSEAKALIAAIEQMGLQVNFKE